MTFQYRENTPVLKDILFKFLSASITALAGASGSGKSTIAGLLLKLYEPCQGTTCRRCLVVESRLSVSSFLIFLGFYENFVKEIRKIMDSNFNLNSRINQLEKIIACLSFIPEKELAAMPSIAIPPIQRIRLHDVSFQYPGGRNIRYVLEALNGEFRKGETCLIQGKSGCGKSTLMKLLYRELEGYEGNILFNEQELRSCPNFPTYFGQPPFKQP